MIPIESSGKIMNEMNKQFDKQIYYEIQQQKKNGNDGFYKVYSSINKDIFNLTENFDLDDWRKVRVQSYWERYNNCKTDYERKTLTLQHIKAYLSINKAIFNK
jgi:hypothetical protein